MVTDSSKFGKVCLHKIIEPGRITKLITDARVGRDVVDELTRQGVEVVLAGG